MSEPATLLEPALRAYRGSITDPKRWSTWQPRKGDVLVSTPPKCGTTWTQTMLAMLMQKTTKLAEPVPVISPWVDADLGVSAEEVALALERQSGHRRVVKTHTPGDGIALWDGVQVIAVYRHPLDVFFSLRKHNANMSEPDGDEPMCWPIDRAFSYFIEEDADPEDIDRDKLATITRHYTETALSGRFSDLACLHYADLTRNGVQAVERVAKAAGIEAQEPMLAQVAKATTFGAMKANAKEFVPVGGTGFWKSDANFFDSGTSGKWQGVLSEAQIEAYDTRLNELIPDVAARAWLEAGDRVKTD